MACALCTVENAVAVGEGGVTRVVGYSREGSDGGKGGDVLRLRTEDAPLLGTDPAAMQVWLLHLRV